MAALSTIPASNDHHRKWRKGLAVFTKLSPSKRQCYYSPTVLAAATEKVIRHRSETDDDSRHDVKSEDLTASQFALEAGIKVKKKCSDDPAAYDDIDDRYDYNSDPEDDQPGFSPLPMARSVSERSKTQTVPRIWDNEFWQPSLSTDQESQKRYPSSIAMKSYSLSSASSYSHPSSMASSFSVCSGRTLSTQSEHSEMMMMRRGPSIIHKGRFKIVVGQETDDGDKDNRQHIINNNNKDTQTLEWRRKRSCTS